MNLVFQSIFKDLIVKLFWFRSVSFRFVSLNIISHFANLKVMILEKVRGVRVVDLASVDPLPVCHPPKETLSSLCLLE